MLNDFRVNLKLSEIREVKEEMGKARKILLLTHLSPDADAIGSLTAMMAFLKREGKEYRAFSYDKIPDNLSYLKDSREIISEAGELEKENFDLIICLDTGDMKRSGIEASLTMMRGQGVKIINIDHHPSDYGDVNLVDTEAASTSLILYEIFIFWRIIIDNEMATALLAGILLDTNNFTNGATSNLAMIAAAELIRLGGRYGQVTRQLNEQKSWKLWSKVLSRLIKNDKLKVAYSVLLSEDILEEENGFESLANFFNHLEDTRVAMVIKEINQGEIKVSLRSTDGKFNVASVAKFFGGGGHTKAAGFVIRGRMEREGNYWKIV